MNERILIVEDESILHERLRRMLVKAGYEASDYTPNFEGAIKEIHTSRPDLVLLDIDLQGEKTGLDLGEKLSKKYKIPFIYVTQHTDDHTFFKGLNTNHEHFLVKTKPSLDQSLLLRTIQTVLHKQSALKNENQEAIFGLVDYLDETKNQGIREISKVPVNYNDITFFTTTPYKNKDNELENVRVNYLWFLHKGGEFYFYKSSLKSLIPVLPYNFVRINDSYIINIAPGILDGRINGSRVSISKRELTISDTYKDEVNKRFKFFYS